MILETGEGWCVGGEGLEEAGVEGLECLEEGGGCLLLTSFSLVILAVFERVWLDGTAFLEMSVIGLALKVLFLLLSLDPLTMSLMNCELVRVAFIWR